MSRFRPELNFATVISLIALFVGLGGGAYAVKLKLKQNSVKSKHIAPDAATGADVSEGTLSKVPSASNADVATNASNAAAVGGVSVDGLQFGDGIDDAGAGLLDETETGGIILIDGAVGFDCDATPTLRYEDVAGDPFMTNLWVEGAPHELVTDGGTSAGFTQTATGDTTQVHVVGLFVAHVVASIVWDGVDTECTVAFTSQENVGENAFLLSADDERRLRDPNSRRDLPDGWVPLRRSP